MKYSLLLLTIVLGCTSPTETNPKENEAFTTIDSIIGESKKNLLVLDSTSKRTDSTITGKVEKTVKQIQTLKEEVKQLKEENNELKAKVNDANDVGKPYKLLPVSNGENNR